LLIPLSLIYRRVGVHDSRPGLIIAYTVFTLPLTTLMMHSYFRQVPRSLEEAAQIDGCTSATAVLRITAPLVWPGVLAASTFAFIACWTDFAIALVLTGSDAGTISTFFAELAGSAAGQSEASAIAVLALLPPVALGLAARRALVRALTLGLVME
jgi:multiple sugar transport system permease protein